MHSPSTVKQFLNKYSLAPDTIQPEECAEEMLRHMTAGLSGNTIDMPMIPTYLKGISAVPFHKPVIVIDAGGTNFRCALAEFDETGCHLSGYTKSKMPGTLSPVTWQGFIDYVADCLLPLVPQTGLIGFCFSYSAAITAEIDGIVQRIDKEVTVTGCEGQLVGASLSKALEQRGFPGRRVIILNDTVAALLGGACGIDLGNYSDFIGMICGTGINVCAPAAFSRITKLPLSGAGSMLINFEAGCYSGMPRGPVDEEVDLGSNVPGEKLMEKMCSGAYIGKIFQAALRFAVKDQYLSRETLDRLERLDSFGGSVADELARGEDRHGLFASGAELEFAQEVAQAVFRRSARCMATVILAIMLMNDSGKTPEHPMCVCAEGSLISCSKYFLPELRSCLESISHRKYARHTEILLGKETTLPGSAVAALLNA